MVQVPWALTRLYRLWAWSWYVGYRLYHGRAQWWLASFSRRLRNGPALSNSESAWIFNQRTNGVLQQKSKIRRIKVPRNYKTRDFGEKVYDQSFKKGVTVDDWPLATWPSWPTYRRVGSPSRLLWRHTRTRGRRRTFKFDCASPAPYILESE